MSHGWDTTIKKDATRNGIAQTSSTVQLEDLQSTMDTLVANALKAQQVQKGAGRYVILKYKT